MKILIIFLVADVLQHRQLGSRLSPSGFLRIQVQRQVRMMGISRFLRASAEITRKPVTKAVGLFDDDGDDDPFGTRHSLSQSDCTATPKSDFFSKKSSAGSNQTAPYMMLIT
jgi:hypothetical protein